MRGDPTGTQNTFAPFACPDAAPGGVPKKTLPVSTYILPACMHDAWGIGVVHTIIVRPGGIHDATALGFPEE